MTERLPGRATGEPLQNASDLEATNLALRLRVEDLEAQLKQVGSFDGSLTTDTARLLRDVFESASDGIFVKDVEGRYILVNPADAQALDLTVPEMVGKFDRDLFDSVISREVEEADRQIMASGRPEERDVVVENGGRRRVFSILKQTHLGPGGEVLGILGISRDVTEARDAELRLGRAQLELRESRGRYRQLFDLSPVGIAVIDREGRYLHVNRTYCLMYGYEEKELLGHSFVDLVVPSAEREKRRRQLRNVLDTTPELRVSEQQNLRKDGTLRWIRYHSDYLRDDSGEVEGFVICGEDATQQKNAYQVMESRIQTRTAALTATNALLREENTERRRAEGQLVASEARYRGLLETIPHGICECGLDGLVGFVSPSLATLLESSSDKLVGTHLWQFADGSTDRVQLRQVFEQVAQRKSGSFFCRLRRAGENGVEVQIDWGIRSGELEASTGLVVVVTNLMERRRAEAEARRHRDELAHLSRVSSVGELASSLAHELNQPLSIICNCAEALRMVFRERQDVDPRETRFVNSVEEQAQRASEIIRRLRNFIRKQPSSRAHIDVNTVVKDVLNLLGTEFQHRHTELAVAYHPTALGVYADAIQIQQVVVNLLQNAMDAISECPEAERTIEVSTRISASGHAEILVSDSGPRLGDEVIARLFEPFFSTKQQGLGIGLVISQSILESHSGELSLERAGARGLRFRCRLPLAN